MEKQTAEITQVVPWGRNFEEYRAMFALGEADLARPILDVGGGPASFNAEATERGHDVVSADPMYDFSRPQIAGRIEATTPQVAAVVRNHPERFVWTNFSGPDDLIAARTAAMERFLADYDAGRAAGRYVTGSLPALPFPDGAFAIALCSHFLFLYSEQLDTAFHLAAMEELMRVAQEVRVFPLLTLKGARSLHLRPVLMALRKQPGLQLQINPVAYEFQKGGRFCLTAKRLRGWSTVHGTG